MKLMKIMRLDVILTIATVSILHGRPGDRSQPYLSPILEVWPGWPRVCLKNWGLPQFMAINGHSKEMRKTMAWNGRSPCPRQPDLIHVSSVMMFSLDPHITIFAGETPNLLPFNHVHSSVLPWPIILALHFLRKVFSICPIKTAIDSLILKIMYTD